MDIAVNETKPDPVIAEDATSSKAEDGEFRVKSDASASSPAEQVTAPAVAAEEEPAATMLASVAPDSSGLSVFINATTGNDAAAGTEATPWRTLSRISSLAAGTKVSRIYLHCASTFRESLTLIGAQLAVGAALAPYGDCASGTRPWITGGDDYSGNWKLASGVWSRTIARDTPKVMRLSIDGFQMRTAQWPKHGSAEVYAYAGAASIGRTNSLVLSATDLATLSSKDLTGATIQVRVEPWTLDERRVVAFDKVTGVLTFDSPLRYALREGTGFILQNKQWMLQRTGDFFHDEATGTLYAMPTSSSAQSNLNLSAVEGARRDIPLSINSASDFSVVGIGVRMARTDGVRLTNVSAAIVDQIESRENGGNGILVTTVGQFADSVASGRSVTIRNSTFRDNWTTGIHTSRMPFTTIFSNTVLDTGTISYGGPSEAALFAGNGASVGRNLIRRSAFRGIRFSGADGSRIYENTLSEFCMRLSDCAGIYWRLGERVAGRQSKYTSSVQGNIVRDAKPFADGATGVGVDLVAGIYLDDYSQGVTVASNVVTNVPYGVYLHNASYNTIDNNRIWLTTKIGLRAQMDQTDGDFLTYNTFSNNQLVPIAAAEGTFPALPTVNASLAVSYRSKAHEKPLPSLTNKFTGNKLVPLFGSSTLMAQVTGASEATTNYTGSAWKTLMPTDLVTTGTSYKIYKLVKGPELLSYGTFDAGLNGWAYYFAPPSTGTVTASSLSTGAIGCEGTCATLTSTSTSDQLYSTTPFVLQPRKLYAVSFTAALGGTGAVTFPFINRSKSPWTSLLPSNAWSKIKPISGNAGDVIEFEGMFSPTSDEPARVSLRTAAPGVPVHFDSVSVREVVDFETGSPAAWTAIVGNSLTPASTVTCQSLGWPAGCTAVDVGGARVTFPLSLPARTTRMFLRTDTPWLQQ
jgi:parallel beta-helix repeat protein